MRPRRRPPAGVEPLSPQRKWRAITFATLLLVPAFWALLAGLVSTAADDKAGAPNPAAALALGFAIVPFVFVVLAFASGHPRAPGAVLRAMGLALLVGIPVSAAAGDAVTGVVAAVSAGGAIALRSDPGHTGRARAVGVAVATAYTFLLVHTVSALVLLPAPIFPLTAIGVADHLSERRFEREHAAA
jgi:hypothetical protein